MENFGNMIKKGLKTVHHEVMKKVNIVQEIPREVENIIHKTNEGIKEEIYSYQNNPFEKKLTDEEFTNLFETFSNAKKLPREEKIKKLKDIKESVNWFRRMIAEKEKKLIDKLSAEPTIEEAQVRNLFKDAFNGLPLNTRQYEQMQDILDSFCIRHNKIVEMRQEFPDDATLFEELIGIKAEGPVEIIATPISFYIRAHANEDYAKIYGLGDINWKNFNTDIQEHKEKFSSLFKDAKKSGGVQIYASIQPELSGGGLIAERAMHRPLMGFSKQVLEHESQHALHKFFDQRIDEIISSDYFSQKILEISDNDPWKLHQVFHEIYDERLKDMEARGKDEILAFYKDGSSLGYIIDILTKRKGLYDYYEDSKWYGRIPFLSALDHPNGPRLDMENEQYNQASSFADADIAEKIEILESFVSEGEKQTFYKTYHKHLREGIQSIKLLENSGMPRGIVIRIFTHEDLQSWPRIARQLTEKKN